MAIGQGSGNGVMLGDDANVLISCLRIFPESKKRCTIASNAIIYNNNSDRELSLANLNSCCQYFYGFSSLSHRLRISSPGVSFASVGEGEMASEQLNRLVNSMFQEGLLDEQFTQLQMLQDANNPGFVAEVISLFCEDSERILGELSKLLDQPVIDFLKVDAYVHQLKGSSSSVGAQHVKLACIEFRQHCEDQDKEGCIQALHVVKNEYYNLRSKFETMIQLEQGIFAYNAKQQS